MRVLSGRGCLQDPGGCSEHGVILGSLDLLLVDPFQLGRVSDSISSSGTAAHLIAVTSQGPVPVYVSMCKFIYFSMPVTNYLVSSFLSLSVRSFDISWQSLVCRGGHSPVPVCTHLWLPSPCSAPSCWAFFLLQTRDLCPVPALWAGFTALPQPLCCCSALISRGTQGCSTARLLWPLWGCAGQL